MFKDISDEIITKLYWLQIDLIKEAYETNGEFLGTTFNDIEYRNYLIDDPIMLGGGGFSGNFNLANYTMKDYSGYQMNGGSYQSGNFHLNANVSNLDPKMKLSEHYTLGDLCVTSKVPLQQNLPTSDDCLQSLNALANYILEPLYTLTGGQIRINSAYRGPIVNSLVGGSPTSQHSLGQAVDLDAIGSINNIDLFHILFSNIANNKLEVGQLIWEGEDSATGGPGWVHVSLPYSKKNQILALAPKRDINNILASQGLVKATNMM